MSARKFRTPAALGRAIDKYFRSIRRTVEVTELCPTGEYDKYGHAVLEGRVVKDDEGNAIKRVEYVIAPRMTALRLALGVDATTWGRYAAGEIGDDDEQKAKYAAVCRLAKDVCEDWLRGEELTRTKGLAGVMRELEVNYGDGKDQRLIVETKAPPTMDEKIELLRSLGLLAEDGAKEEGE